MTKEQIIEHLEYMISLRVPPVVEGIFKVIRGALLSNDEERLFFDILAPFAQDAIDRIG